MKANAEGGLKISNELISDLIRSMGRVIWVKGTDCPSDCQGHEGLLSNYYMPPEGGRLMIAIHLAKKDEHRVTDRLDEITLWGADSKITWWRGGDGPPRFTVDFEKELQDA